MCDLLTIVCWQDVINYRDTKYHSDSYCGKRSKESTNLNEGQQRITRVIYLRKIFRRAILVVFKRF